MSAKRSVTVIAGWMVFLLAGLLISAGCSGTAGEDVAAMTARGLAELQAGMPTGNPPAWYTEKLADLGYEVKTLRYERSDLLAYDVAKGPAAFHIELALDPETATASGIEIAPVGDPALAAHAPAETADRPAADATSAEAAPSPSASAPPAAADASGESSPAMPAPEEPPAETHTADRSEPARPEEGAAAPSVVVLPAQTLIATRLNDPLDSGTAQLGDRFSMLVPEPVSLAGITVLPAGSRIRGYVAEVQKARRPNGAGRLTLKADRIEANGAAVEFEGLVTAEGERLEGEGSVREDLKEIAVGAGVGGLVGGLLGGGKGVVAGILIGGGGTFVATKGEEVRLPPDTPLYVELREEVSVPVRR